MSRTPFFLPARAPNVVEQQETKTRCTAREAIRGLVLASGYYYATVRTDVVALSGPAVPVIGEIIRYTLSPLLGRLMWPFATKKIFGPSRVPEKFGGYPKQMALRPSQIRAAAAKSALMIPDAFAFRGAVPDFIMKKAARDGRRQRATLVILGALSSCAEPRNGRPSLVRRPREGAPPTSTRPCGGRDRARGGPGRRCRRGRSDRIPSTRSCGKPPRGR